VRCALIAAALAAAAVGCGPEGDTCGRGRCHPGETCTDVLGPGRKNQGWNDPKYPNVLHEWWCLRDCPSGKSCASGQCLQDPADDEILVCAVDSVAVEYQSAGRACLCDPSSNTCFQDSPVSGFDIVTPCFGTTTVIASCTPNVWCAAGTFHSGDSIPGVREFFAGSNLEHLYCVANATATFAPQLPEGETVRIYADTDNCP
jgi:hypothetical protein